MADFWPADESGSDDDDPSTVEFEFQSDDEVDEASRDPDGTVDREFRGDDIDGIDIGILQDPFLPAHVTHATQGFCGQRSR